MAISLFNLFSLLSLAVVRVAAAQGECKPARCGDYEPAVQFPFRLKGRQPDHCGYLHPDFELYCSPSNTTEMEFQYPMRASPNNVVGLLLQVKGQVQCIDYGSQLVLLSHFSANYSLPNHLSTAVNFSSASAFEMWKIRRISSYYPNSYRYPFSRYFPYFPNNLSPYPYEYNFTLFNCSSEENEYDRWLINSGHGYEVIALSTYSNVWKFNLSSCTKIYDIYDVLLIPYEGNYLRVQWLKPSCRDFQALGKYCRLENSCRVDEMEHSGIPTRPGNGASGKLVVAGVLGTLFLALVICIVSYRIISLNKKKEDQKKIEEFLDDYKTLKPTRFSYADIKKITNQFQDKLGEGGYGTVYKGNISNDIAVAVKVLNNFKGDGEEFVNEVGTIGTIHHINVVRLVGYCADGYKRALLYEFLPNDCLEKLISSRKRINALGWEKLQQIAIGIAKGLDYLHQGCNQRILHFDIKPQNILLDHNFNPKVADFGLAKLCSKDQSAVSMTAARGTIGYIAPEVFSRNFGNVSYKSDVYSFGMLLLDMVGGRKRFQAAGEGDSSQMYYPEWMYKQLEKGEEVEIQIDKEEDNRIFKKLAIVGLWCIQWCPADRPSMKVAIQMLEGENMPTMPPNPFAAAKSTKPNAFTTGSSHSYSEIDTISETT